MAKRSFSDQLRRAVLNSDLTRYRIAQQTGIAEAALSRFVHGKSGLSLRAIDKLVDCLDLEIRPRQRQKKGK